LALTNWGWQAADGWLGKARSGGDEIGPNPTDSAKNGTKKSVLTDAAGGPLSMVIAPANVNDHKLLEATIETMVIERPEPTEQAPPQPLSRQRLRQQTESRSCQTARLQRSHPPNRRRKTRSEGPEEISGAAIRGRKNSGLVIQMPGLVDAL